MIKQSLQLLLNMDPYSNLLALVCFPINASVKAFILYTIRLPLLFEGNSSVAVLLCVYIGGFICLVCFVIFLFFNISGKPCVLIVAFFCISRKHAYIILTPFNPSFIQFMEFTLFFLTSAQKHRLWVLDRTASSRRF